MTAHEYAGDFEVHVTIHAADAAGLDQFSRWCQQRGVKCVHIVLSRGESASQPMATWRRGSTVLSAIRDEADDFATDAVRSGFEVTRVKIEAAPGNENLPQTNQDAETEPAANYFEHHIKLDRPREASALKLTELCESHGAHLSRNAFRQTAGDREERFVTLRTYGVGAQNSQRQLAALLDDFAAFRETVIETESEYCVYDSNIALDAGWLPAAVK